KWEAMGGQLPSAEASKATDTPSDTQNGGSSQRGRDSGRNGRGFGSGNGNFGGGFNGGRGGSFGGGSGTSELTVVGEGDAKKMEFHFKNTPWPDVIQLFAERAGYSLVMQSPPSGRFNYDDSKRIPPQEGLDVLN